MTTTQADSARALGMPPDRVETPAPFGDAHDLLNIPPAEIRPDDRYKYAGRWLTVHQRLDLAEGDIALYFVELVHGAIERAVIRVGVMAVSVYRPKADT